MSESFYFEAVELFTVGTLGPKGQRAFYLQSRADGVLLSLKLEKQQAAALGEHLDQMLNQLPSTDAGPPPDDLDLREPVVEAWTIGSMGIAYDRESDRVVVVAEEFVGDRDVNPAHARFVLSRPQVTALVDRVRSVVAAGRPPCPYCMRPLELANRGWCPCHN